MICRHCGYAMHAFERVCPRCHGKGAPKDVPEQRPFQQRGESAAKRREKLLTFLQHQREGGARITAKALRAVLRELEPGDDEKTTRSLLPLLTQAPDGPLRQALYKARHVDIGAAAEVLQVEPDDFLIVVDDIAMESDDVGQHIPGGSWVLMRPTLDADGEVALCRVKRRNGEYTWTIRRWMPQSDEDSKSNDVALTDDATDIVPVAVLRGVIAPSVP